MNNHDILEAQVRITREMVERLQTEALEPMIILFCDNGETYPALIKGGLPEGSENKRRLFGVIGRMAAEEIDAEVVSIATIAEAWMAAYQSQEQIDSDDYVRPAQRPDRKEVVIIDVLGVDGSLTGAILPIVRDSQNRMHLGQPEFHDSDNVLEAPMLELFFPEYHSHRELPKEVN